MTTLVPAPPIRRVAPRWVTWALILFGSLEIPWVIYLVLFQEPVVRAHHVRVTTVGLGIGSLTLCLLAAWGILRRRRWAPIACVGAVTILTFTASVSAAAPALRAPGLLPGGLPTLALVVPPVVAGVLASRSLLAHDSPSDRALTTERVAALVLALSVLPLSVRTVEHAHAVSSTAVITQARALVVALDTGEVVGLLGAGLASLRGRVPPTLVLATMAGVLLACDAWTNVMGTTGQAFQEALVYLVVGEIPAMALCTIAVAGALRRRPSDSVR